MPASRDGGARAALPANATAGTSSSGAAPAATAHAWPPALHRISAGALALAALASLAPAQAVAQTCSEVMAAFRVAEPPRSDRRSGSAVPAPPDLGAEGLFDCTREETAMFIANHAAAKTALPPADRSELYGTWLGDDVLLYVAGVTVPGQEVLRIDEGPEPDSLKIRQYWMKIVYSDANPIGYFDADGSYTGLVTEGTLQLSKDTGAYRPTDYGDGRFLYSGLTFEYERSYDLWVMSRLNHFEREARFRLAGDTLVLESLGYDQPTRQPAASLTTYSRVADRAPDRALATIATFELSMGRNFECLTWQFSEGRGALFDLLAPWSAEDVVARIDEQFAFGYRLMEAREAVKANPGDDALRDRFLSLADGLKTRGEDPDWRRFYEAITGPICYDYF